MEPISNVKKVFGLNDIEFEFEKMPKELEDIFKSLTNSLNINCLENIYTGRQIAVIPSFTSTCWAFESTKACWMLYSLICKNLSKALCT